MNIENAVDEVAKHFKYRSDDEVSTKFNGDPWMIMDKINGEYHGDCEDFSLTAMYLACDKSLLKFLDKVLIKKKYKLYTCVVGNSNDRHCVGNAEGYWFDNGTRKAVSGFLSYARLTNYREYKEHSRMRIACNLYSGALLKLVGCKKSTSYLAQMLFNTSVFIGIYSVVSLIMSVFAQILK